MLSDTYQRIPLELIDVRRDERQRQQIDTSDIIDSIRTRGVLQPIIVEFSRTDNGRYILIAGERRYTASHQLGLSDIPARLAGTLSQAERQIIELEENIRRRDLPWQDECRAHRRIHQIYCEMHPDGWSQYKTAEQIGIAQSTLATYITVANGLDGPHGPQLEAAAGFKAALNMLTRRSERAMDDAMNDLLGEFDETKPTTHLERVDTSSGVSHSDNLLDANRQHSDVGSGSVSSSVSIDSILNQSFLNWAPTYAGRCVA